METGSGLTHLKDCPNQLFLSVSLVISGMDSRLRGNDPERGECLVKLVLTYEALNMAVYFMLRQSVRQRESCHHSQDRLARSRRRPALPEHNSTL